MITPASQCSSPSEPTDKTYADSSTVAYAYAGREGGEPLTMQMPGNTTARDGDRHKASFEPADCFVFDAETQQRIR